MRGSREAHFVSADFWHEIILAEAESLTFADAAMLASAFAEPRYPPAGSSRAYRQRRCWRSGDIRCVTGRGQAFWSKIVFRHEQTNGCRCTRGRKVPIRSEARVANGNIVGMALNPQISVGALQYSGKTVERRARTGTNVGRAAVEETDFAQTDHQALVE